MSDATPASAEPVRERLHPHPGGPAPVFSVSAAPSRPRLGLLRVRYFLEGEIDRLVIPPKGLAERRDELWRRTCFEAFIRAEGDPTYHEFNFAPSTVWAAYRFDSYRAGMRPADVSPPRISVETRRDAFILEAEIEAPILAAAARWRIGLSAVLEEADGAKSYWALAHAPGAPDFHHEATFACLLEAG